MSDLKDEILTFIAKQRAEDRLLSDSRHQENQDAFKSINLTLEALKPIAKVYGYFDGFGTIMQFIFKWIVVPISVIIGIVVTIKNIHK